MHEVHAKGIVGQGGVVNFYRGCQHGCIYCDSRSTCYNMQHDFEDIEVKVNAPELLDDALCRRRKRSMLFTGAMCDPYMPLEKELCLTQRCLEIIEKHGFGVSVHTKSDLVLRDADIIKRINDRSKAVVMMTLTTFDEDLCRIIEPNVAATRRRFEVLCEFKKLGVPTVVWISPILPFINDTEENLIGVLGYCKDAGVKAIICPGIGVTLRDGDRQYFYKKLDRHFPGLKEKYIKTYGNSYEVASPNGEKLAAILHDFCRKNGIIDTWNEAWDFVRSYPLCESEQLSLFDM